MKQKILMLLTTVFLVGLLAGCNESAGLEHNTDTNSPADAENSVHIRVSDDGITVDGEAASNKADAAVYTSNDIVYYEQGRDFTYGEGSEKDAHSAEEAAEHTVVNIVRPGIYVLSGTLSAGQIAVDLGEEAKEDPDAVVTLVLDGLDITCTVAPAVIFYNVYECGSTDTETATKDVDTSAAGANVIIADGTTNTVSGSHVARIYKPDTVVLNKNGTEVEEAKKLHKYDAAFYSKMSMNVRGESAATETARWGTLYINADNEGMDSELHLTINGGNIVIRSGNDGINTNEDGVSVTTINDGTVNITVTGETGEGDGIDSNGWLVINGGELCAYACADSADSGIDSDMGIHINGGMVVASGHMLDRIEDGGQNYAVFQFAEANKSEMAYEFRAVDSDTAIHVAIPNNFSILLISMGSMEAGEYTLWQGENQLAHSGTGTMMVGGPGMGGFPPGGMQPGGPMVPPEWEGLDMAGFHWSPVEGMDRQPPRGFERPENEAPTGRPEGFEGQFGFKNMERKGNGSVSAPEGAVTEPENGTVTLPDGGTIQMPAMGKPGGFGSAGSLGGMMDGTGERSTVFTVSDGGNYFNNILPAE